MTKRRGTAARARGFLRATRAVSALEYAILVGVIVVAVAGALNTFGTDLKEKLEGLLENALSATTPGSSTDDN